MLDKAKDKIVDKALEKLPLEKLRALRKAAGKALSAANYAESIAEGAASLMEATLKHGVRDIEAYREMRVLDISPTGRHYKTDRIVPWGSVDWRPFDDGGEPIDVLNNFFNHGSR